MYTNEIEQYLETVKIDKSPHTYRSYSLCIEKLFAYLKEQGIENLKDVSSLNMRNFQSYLKNSGLEHSSINSYVRPIRAMFNWMVENEYISKSPMKAVKDLKVSKKIIDFLSEEEQEKIVSVCEDRLDKLIFILLISTGMRRSEICSLNLEDYNGTHIKVHGKGNKERSLALQEGVAKLLDQYIQYRNKKYGNSRKALIVSKNGDHLTGDAIYKRIGSILEKAGLPKDRIEKIHPHSLRHSFTANMLESGADIYVCQMGLGHERIETTMRYAHLHNRTLDNAMRNQKPLV